MHFSYQSSTEKGCCEGFPQSLYLKDTTGNLFYTETSHSELIFSSNTKPNDPLPTFAINTDGDKGTSKLLSGLCVQKNHLVIHAIGHTEELNAQIGTARVYAREANHPYVEHLKRIQTILIDLTNKISRSAPGSIVEDSPLDSHTKEMEEWIAHYSSQISPEQIEHSAYIVPGGSHSSAALQLSRTICRRVERSAVDLVDEKFVKEDVLAYLNRLGDFLLILSRIATKLDERTELVYIPKPAQKST